MPGRPASGGLEKTPAWPPRTSRGSATTGAWQCTSSSIDPHIPEVHLRLRRQILHLLTLQVQVEKVPGAHERHILIDQLLEPGPALELPCLIRRAQDLNDEPVLLGVVPKPRPGLRQRRKKEHRARPVSEIGDEDVIKIRLITLLRQRRPVEHLQIDL